MELDVRFENILNIKMYYSFSVMLYSIMCSWCWEMLQNEHDTVFHIYIITFINMSFMFVVIVIFIDLCSFNKLHLELRDHFTVDAIEVRWILMNGKRINHHEVYHKM